MVQIKIANLTLKNLNNAPEWDSHPYSCKYCIYWEYPEECIDPEKENKEENLQKKINWVKNTLNKFGNCGKILYVDKKPVGYAQYAPPEFLPNSFRYPVKPDDDAVLISCLFIVQKDFRRMGLGRKLLQSIIDDLSRRKIKAVETFARKDNPENPSGPIDFYLKNGFKIYKKDKGFPLMRLEL
ncbi:MAG: GNAT family N-acetyltransferase [candidate division WOR-3 bacterium]